MENNIIAIQSVTGESISNAIEKRLTGMQITTDNIGECIQFTSDIMDSNGNRKVFTIRDYETATRLQRIKVAQAAGDVSQFVLCKELSKLTAADADSLGFESVDILCQSLFGLAKSTVFNYRRIAKFFVNDDYTLVDSIPSDTPLGTLNLLLSLVVIDENGNFTIDNITTLFVNNIITPYMKQSVIKQRLSALREIEKERDENVTALSELSQPELDELKSEVVARSSQKKEKKKSTPKNITITSEETNNDSTQSTDNESTVVKPYNTDEAKPKGELPLEEKFSLSEQYILDMMKWYGTNEKVFRKLQDLLSLICDIKDGWQ